MTTDESLMRRFLSPQSARDFHGAYLVWACIGLVLTTLEIGRYGYSEAVSFWLIVAVTGALCGAGGAWIGKLTGINIHVGAGFAILAWLLFSLKAAAVHFGA